MIVLFILAAGLIVYACGDDSISVEQTEFEKALFVAYAGINPDEDLNAIMIEDLEDVVDDLKDVAAQYILDNLDEIIGGEAPEAIDLSDPPEGLVVPEGMSGIITYGIDNLPVVDVAANITLSDYLNSTRTYSGYINLEGTVDGTTLALIVDPQPDDVDFETLDIDVPSLTITYSNKSYTSASYSGWSVSKDNSGSYPDYTLDGSFSVKSHDYDYSGFDYNKGSSTSLSVDGIVDLDDEQYDIQGSVTLNSSQDWVGGNLTITWSDAAVDVTLNGSDASFDDGADNQWEKENWASDTLVP
ncbi:MAG: hypothetical protein JW920_11845 [Deltaproteobacteria bacterium]|nr:hypothetical protein [Deltaproteobacteria bacterium]